MKLLIVDDEKLDREGLAGQINWRKFDVSSVQTAKNGFEAIEIMKSNKFDILITDVKMPGMTGIQLAEKTRDIFPDVKIIFVSGYDDFEYIKNALKLNAYEYILKPIKTDEMILALEKIRSEMNHEQRIVDEKIKLQNIVNEGLPVMKHKFLCDLIYGTSDIYGISDKMEYLDVNISGTEHCILIVEIDDGKVLEASLSDDELKQKLEQIGEILKKENTPDFAAEVVHMEKFRFAVVLSYTMQSENDFYTEIGCKSKMVISDILDQCGISATIGVGSPVKFVEELSQSYVLSCEALLQKMYAGKGTVLFYHNRQRGIRQQQLLDNVDVELVRCITSRDIHKAYHLIDYIFDSFEAEGSSDGAYIQNYCINIISKLQLCLLEANERIDNVFGSGVVLWDKIMKFETILDIRQWMKNVFRAVLEYLESKNEKKSSQLTEKVLEYIHYNYQKEITLKEIADDCYYSPNYLGAIFKEDVGIGFSEYLTEYRMKRAAELLKDIRMKTFEVAEKVGYTNVNSFTRQFKTNFGVTPSEFRNRR